MQSSAIQRPTEPIVSPGAASPHVAELTDVFFLICSVEDRGHLQVLARLSRVLGWPGFLDALRLFRRDHRQKKVVGVGQMAGDPERVIRLVVDLVPAEFWGMDIGRKQVLSFSGNTVSSPIYPLF